MWMKRSYSSGKSIYWAREEHEYTHPCSETWDLIVRDANHFSSHTELFWPLMVSLKCAWKRTTKIIGGLQHLSYPFRIMNFPGDA